MMFLAYSHRSSGGPGLGTGELALCIFTARKQSLRRLCFHRCLSDHRWGVPGGLCPGGSLSGGDLCPGGSLSGGDLCPEGVSVRGGICPGGGFCQRPPAQYSNEWTVRILLEFILVC